MFSKFNILLVAAMAIGAAEAREVVQSETTFGNDRKSQMVQRHADRDLLQYLTTLSYFDEVESDLVTTADFARLDAEGVYDLSQSESQESGTTPGVATTSCPVKLEVENTGHQILLKGNLIRGGHDQLIPSPWLPAEKVVLTEGQLTKQSIYQSFDCRLFYAEFKAPCLSHREVIEYVRKSPGKIKVLRQDYRVRPVGIQGRNDADEIRNFNRMSRAQLARMFYAESPNLSGGGLTFRNGVIEKDVAGGVCVYRKR